MVRSVAFIACVLAVLPQDPRSPVPADADQEKIRKDLQDAYKVEYGRKGREDRRTLAQKLWSEAGTAKNQTEKYVLLQEVRILASEAMDLSLAFEAIQATTLGFDLKPEPLRSAAISIAKKAIRTPEDAVALAGICLGTAQKAMTANDYDGATALAGAAKDFAQAGREPVLVERAKAMAAESTEGRKEFGEAEKAALAITANKDDGEAHAIRGRFYCFMKGDWATGLPHLEKASDAALRDLAAKEKVPPASSDGQVDLAVGWSDLAAKEKAPYKRKYQERALHWISEAWPNLSDREKTKLEKRLDDLEAVVGRVNLFLARTNVVSGVWGITPSSIKAPGGTVGTMVEILYVPPPEYDLELLIKYDGIPAVVLGLIAGQTTRFTVKLDSRNGSAIGLLGDKKIEGSTYPGVVLPEKAVTPVTVSVRRDGVTVAAGTQTVLRYRGAPSGLGWDANTWKPKNPNTLWLGYWRNFAGGGVYEIQRMTLLPVSGRGVRLR